MFYSQPFYSKIQLKIKQDLKVSIYIFLLHILLILEEYYPKDIISLINFYFQLLISLLQLIFSYLNLILFVFLIIISFPILY